MGACHNKGSRTYTTKAGTHVPAQTDGRETIDKDTRTSDAPALSAELVRRANAAGTFVDYGDAGVRQYNKHVDEINGMDMTADERTTAINKLHSLMTAQLEAESKAFSPYSMGVGPARFDRNKMSKAEDKAANARAEVSGFMNDLKRTQERKAKEREQKALTDAMLNALNTGALEFTVNGTTWRRKTRRAKTFTSI